MCMTKNKEQWFKCLRSASCAIYPQSISHHFHNTSRILISKPSDSFKLFWDFYIKNKSNFKIIEVQTLLIRYFLMRLLFWAKMAQGNESTGGKSHHWQVRGEVSWIIFTPTMSWLHTSTKYSIHTTSTLSFLLFCQVQALAKKIMALA